MQLQWAFLLQMRVCRSLRAPGTTRPPQTPHVRDPSSLFYCLAMSGCQLILKRTAEYESSTAN